MTIKTAETTSNARAADAAVTGDATIKPQSKRGGRRLGAGRKPDYLKRLGIKPVNAAQIMERYDEHEAWGWFLKHPNASIRLQAWEYLTDRRDGKPKQAVDISGHLNHAHTAYRDPRLAGLSDEELAALDGLTRKLLPASPDAPAIQAKSEASGAVQCPIDSSQEQKRETTFPMANGNGLRTQPTGDGSGPIIEIPASEPQPDGAA